MNEFEQDKESIKEASKEIGLTDLIKKISSVFGKDKKDDVYKESNPNAFDNLKAKVVKNNNKLLAIVVIGTAIVLGFILKYFS